MQQCQSLQDYIKKSLFGTAILHCNMQQCQSLQDYIKKSLFGTAI
jgi:hypothetical protein